MTAIESLLYFFGISSKSISKQERLMLEADLIFSIFKEIKEMYKREYDNYFFIQFNNETEKTMLDVKCIRWIIKDILLTENYTLPGIAYYTETPEEVIYELVVGNNVRPSAIFLQRVIELHREVKRDLYIAIKKKIIEQYLIEAQG